MQLEMPNTTCTPGLARGLLNRSRVLNLSGYGSTTKQTHQNWRGLVWKLLQPEKLG